MTAVTFPLGSILGDSTTSTVDARSTSSAARPFTGGGGSLFPFTSLFIDEHESNMEKFYGFSYSCTFVFIRG